VLHHQYRAPNLHTPNGQRLDAGSSPKNFGTVSTLQGWRQEGDGEKRHVSFLSPARWEKLEARLAAIFWTCLLPALRGARKFSAVISLKNAPEPSFPRLEKGQYPQIMPIQLAVSLRPQQKCRRSVLTSSAVRIYIAAIGAAPLRRG
jgi:hypothetical protein